MSEPFRTFEPVTALRAILAPVTLAFLILAAVTAFALIWTVPTELGARAVTAATPVPVSATPNAIHATTIAGDGR